MCFYSNFMGKADETPIFSSRFCGRNCGWPYEASAW
jgi:hypothetical protein